jgi:hypothetical protein
MDEIPKKEVGHIHVIGGYNISCSKCNAQIKFWRKEWAHSRKKWVQHIIYYAVHAVHG